MKKLFTLFIALTAMVMCTHAQTLLSEGFENGTIPTGWTVIDSDGDTYNWENSGTSFASGYGHNGSNYCMVSSSYVNYVGALTPNNWLITPAVNLTSNSTLTFWVCAMDASYPADHYGVYISTTGTDTSNFTLLFEETMDANGGPRAQGTWGEKTVNLSNYTGQTVYIAFRHFNCTDAYWLCLDDVEIFAQPTSPTIISNKSSLDLGYVTLGDTSASQNATVTGYVISNGITATTAAPFAVSADGTTFSTTATLANAGGTLYVNFTPTTAGVATGSVTLSADSATSVVITLTGTGVDCSQPISTLPWTEDFENDVFPPLCWDLASINDTTWAAYSYSGTWASCLGASTTQNEGLITKALNFGNYTNTVLMEFNFMSNYDYVNNGTTDLKIYISTDGGSTYTTTPVWAMSQFGSFSNWSSTTALVDLSAYAGQSNVKIKFNYEGSTCQVLLDNVHIYYYDDPTIISNTQSLDYYTEVGSTDVNTASVSAYNLTGALTATTSAPFAVSADGISFSTTATLASTGGTFYVQYTGTTGTQTGTVVLSSANATSVTINVTGAGFTCSNDLPITEDFDHSGFLPGCWTSISNNTANEIDVEDDGTGNYRYRFNSYSSADDYTQYLISPMINTSTDLSFSFEWATYDVYASWGLSGYYYSTETFQVGYSTTDNNVNSFNWIDEQEVASEADGMTFYTQTIPSTAKYVAIKYMSEYQYFLYIDNAKIETANSIDEYDFSANIYPNPANSILNVTSTSNINTVEVFNMMGQKVTTVKVNDTQAQINTSNLSTGVYMVRLNTENGVITKKFTVAR